MTDPTDHKSRYFLQSLSKGLNVLQCLADSDGPLRLSEIAQATGTNNATATRCCYTLTAMGYVRRNSDRRYELTPKVISIGYAAVSRLGWRQTAKHYMEELSNDIGETVNLSMLEGAEIIYVLRITTEKILPYDLRIGSRLPVHCTSMGKALMAFTPQGKFEAILDRIDFNALTHRTITSRSQYCAQLEEVRRLGYAVNDEELSVGLRSVAAPVLDAEGRARAALNVAVPTTRVTRRELEERLAPAAMETARLISRALEPIDHL